MAYSSLKNIFVVFLWLFDSIEAAGLPNTSDFNRSMAFELDTNTLGIAPCWYPVSVRSTWDERIYPADTSFQGNYGRLPRILFYCIIIFGLLASHLKWLIAGALAVALTYSGTAAIHACLLVWQGQTRGELDFYALITILSTSGLITVPLINWSATLRKLGSEDGSETGARTIIIYWGFLVTLGLFTLFSQLWIRVPMDDSYFNYSNSTSIYCAPSASQIDYSAGQDPSWETFITDVEFIQENACVDPCKQAAIQWPEALFRTLSDLQLLSQDDYNNSLIINERFFNSYVYVGGIIGTVVLLQGIWAVFFGRRSPRQSRDVIYKYLYLKALPLLSRGSVHHKKWQRRIAKYFAISACLWSFIASVLCVLLFFFNLVALEYLLSNLPQAESARHIGAWSPWVSTALAVFAALVAKFHQPLVHKISERLSQAQSRIKNSIRRVFGRVRRVNNRKDPAGNTRSQESKLTRSTQTGSGKLTPSEEYQAPRRAAPLRFILKEVLAVKINMGNEWASLKAFWRDPDKEMENTPVIVV